MIHREERPFTPCIVSRIQKRKRLPGTPSGGRLGKGAAKRHAGTMARAPEAANVKVRVYEPTTKVIEAHPNERYAFALRGIEFPC